MAAAGWNICVTTKRLGGGEPSDLFYLVYEADQQLALAKVLVNIDEEAVVVAEIEKSVFDAEGMKPGEVKQYV
ncbi:MAG: hypothetical protein WBV18_08990 [Methyloceanibacter sp.]|jgi:hypothetical protein|uniref:hypothetical protein n=1 Tax=Methyloceanibacter sp. TaxID=1965321 RepID=UPI003C37E319